MVLLSKQQKQITTKKWHLYTKIQSIITLKQLTNFGKLLQLYYKSIIECNAKLCTRQYIDKIVYNKIMSKFPV